MRISAPAILAYTRIDVPRTVKVPPHGTDPQEEEYDEGVSLGRIAGQAVHPYGALTPVSAPIFPILRLW